MKDMSRRTFTAALGTTWLTSTARSTWAEDSYPAARTIRFVAPFPAGGTIDFVARILAERLGTLWNVPTIVENVPGASGNIGNNRVAKGPTDGTQILIITPTAAISQFMYAHLSYDPEKDFIPLSQVASVPNLLCVRKHLPVSSTAELIAYAKANPGKLNYASSGIGTSPHLSAELFKHMAGIEMVHVAYRGGQTAVNDLVSGNVDLLFANIPTVVGQARAGTVKALAITTSTRSPFALEYPTIAETLPGYDTTSWSGVAVRTGTPPEICEKIERDTRAACGEQAVRNRLGTQGAEAVGSSAVDFAKYIQDERTKWGTLISKLGLRAQ